MTAGQISDYTGAAALLVSARTVADCENLNLVCQSEQGTQAVTVAAQED